jgi:hypothetical protein
MNMNNYPDKPLSRRSAIGFIFGGFIAAIATITMTETAEAKPGKGRGGRRGNPPGWSRGRKRGWAKRGGPKWGW